MKELVDAALKLAAAPDACTPNRPAIRPEHEPVLRAVRGLIADHTPAPYPEDWVALKLLEGDAEITALMRGSGCRRRIGSVCDALLLKHEDAYLDIAGGRYEWIGRMMRAAVTQPKAGAITRTERIDRVATHPIAGLALLLALLGVAFWLTYTIATPIANWLSTQVLGALDALATLTLSWAPAWLFGLISDGLIHGVGTVFTFLPILIIFFAILGTLEDVGYLARGAYVMDRFMHLMGLHGKSFMPLFLGFGCNVPAVLGSRIIEERRARWLTILLAPLVPCTARLAVLAFLIPAFFLTGATLVSFGLVALNLVVLGRCRDRREQARLPRRPDRVHHGAAALSRAQRPHRGTLRVEQHRQLRQESRHADPDRLDGRVGALVLPRPRHRTTACWPRSVAALEPIGRLMGLDDWRMIVALLTSFFAKENTIATLGILFNAGAESGTLAQEVALVLVPAARFAFLVVVMLFVPCLATIATIKQETNSWRWTLRASG